jgi:hypothetical protein
MAAGAAAVVGAAAALLEPGGMIVVLYSLTDRSNVRFRDQTGKHLPVVSFPNLTLAV